MEKGGEEVVLGKGHLVLVGPGGGKSTVIKNVKGVVDPEGVIDWHAEVLERNGCVRGQANMWEESLDLLSLFFKCVLPVIMGGLKTNRLVLANLIGPQNELVVNKLLRGLYHHCRYNVSVFQLDEETLERQVQQRLLQMSSPSYKRYDPSIPLHPILYTQHRSSYAWTHEIHTLLKGIAYDAQLPILRQQRNLDKDQDSVDDRKDLDLSDLVPSSVPPPLTSLPSSTLRTFGWRDAEERQHLLFEVLPHFFIEYVEDIPLYYYTLDTQASDSAKELILRCCRTSKECYNVHGLHCAVSICITLCDSPTTPEGNITIRWEGGGLPPVTPSPSSPCFLRSYIPSHKLRIPPSHNSRNNKYCILAYYGSFAPLHRGHIEAMEIAKEDREREGYTVMGGYVVPQPGVSTKKELLIDTLQPWRHRAAIAEFLLTHSDWIMLDGGAPFSRASYDFKSVEGFRNHPIHSIAPRLRQTLGRGKGEEDGTLPEGLTVFWVNGSDGFYDANYFNNSNFAAANTRQRKGDRVELLVIDRKDAESNFKKAGVEEGECIHTAYRPQESAYSSTKVRRLMAKGAYSLAAKEIGNDASAAYMMWLWHEYAKADVQTHNGKQA